MSDPEEQSQPPEPQPPGRQAKIGFGTVSILVVFFGIITAMCIGAVLIVAVLAFR